MTIVFWLCKQKTGKATATQWQSLRPSGHNGNDSSGNGDRKFFDYAVVSTGWGRGVVGTGSLAPVTQRPGSTSGKMLSRCSISARRDCWTSVIAPVDS